MTSRYQIHTEAYEGPLDLFYDLVVSDRIDPAALSLARLVEGFLAEISDGSSVDLEHVSEFLLVLALLCRLKARRVLGTGLDPGSEDLPENPDRDLWFQLARLTFEEATEELVARLRERAGFKPREAGPDWSKVDSAPELAFRLDPGDLARVATHIMSRVSAIPDLDHLALDVPDPEQVKAELWRLIGEVRETSFQSLASGCGDRIEMAAWFMGLLELAREGRVSLSQPTPAGRILVQRGPVAGTLVGRV
ncbi:MAG: segregation/condensation protein A [bacterium]|nr:segregation/condensation protein A [bacterium]MDE0602099.1 segregation/condensation protein A [bacterium]